MSPLNTALCSCTGQQSIINGTLTCCSTLCDFNQVCNLDLSCSCPQGYEMLSTGECFCRGVEVRMFNQTVCADRVNLPPAQSPKVAPTGDVAADLTSDVLANIQTSFGFLHVLPVGCQVVLYGCPLGYACDFYQGVCYSYYTCYSDADCEFGSYCDIYTGVCVPFY